MFKIKFARRMTIQQHRALCALHQTVNMITYSEQQRELKREICLGQIGEPVEIRVCEGVKIPMYENGAHSQVKRRPSH